MDECAGGSGEVGQAAPPPQVVAPAGVLFDLDGEAGLTQRADPGRAAVGVAVPGDQAQPFEPRQDVELGDDQCVEAIEPGRVAHGDRIEPAAAARPAGSDPELAALRAEPLAALVGELGGERPGANTGAVGLGDAEDPSDARRADAQPGACAPGEGA